MSIRIAIVGGSMGGCLLALGLQRYSHIEFDIFETWTFHERGAGVGVAPNGQNALDELGLDAADLLQHAGAFTEKAAEAIVAYGEHEGKRLMQIPGGIKAVQRKALLDELLQRLPSDRLHPNKKLTHIEEGEVYKLHFEDGSTYEADTVIGCDGIWSTVRGIVLGKNRRDVTPNFVGYWDARAFMSTEQALERFGPEIIQLDNPREVFYVGEKCTMLFASAPAGNISGVVVAGPVDLDWDPTDSKKPLTRDFLENKFRSWPKPYVKGVIDSLLSPESGPGVIFSEFESREAPTWYRDRICFMGDAAHAALPWMGQGFSMVAEDAAVLAALLGKTNSTQDVERAFCAFDSVRRGPSSRPSHVVKHSHSLAALYSGEWGLDPALAAKKCDTRELFAYLWEGDIKQEINKAVDLYQSA